jgi:hypothetical protein
MSVQKPVCEHAQQRQTQTAYCPITDEWIREMFVGCPYNGLLFSKKKMTHLFKEDES